jgi:RNA polymerase sigma-70 factor (ECF subfamily)
VSGWQFGPYPDDTPHSAYAEPAVSPTTTFEDQAMPLFDSLYNFAHWLAHNREDAEDLVQETYLKALRSFPSFQPGTNFKAWIFKILKNSSCDAFAKRRRRATITMGFEEDFPSLPLNVVNPEFQVIKGTEIEMLRRAIEQLPPYFREVLLLREMEDASYREIAEILSIPIGTVMSRLTRARRVLREALRNSRDERRPGPLLVQPEVCDVGR